TAGTADGLLGTAGRGAPRLVARSAPGPGLVPPATLADAGARRATGTLARRPARVVRAAAGRPGDTGSTHAAAGTRRAAPRTAVHRSGESNGVAGGAAGALNPARALATRIARGH